MENQAPSSVPTRSTLTKLFITMANNTTAHGIPNAARATSILRRLIWSLLFIAAVIMFMWQFSELFMRFLGRPINVNLDIAFSREITFPAVTICNQNPIRQNAMNNNPSMQDQFTPNNPPPDMQQPEQPPPSNNQTAGNITVPPNTRKRRDQEPNTQSQMNQPPPPAPNGNHGPSAGNQQTILLTEILTELPMSERIKYGHQPEYFIVNCTWQGEQCYSSNFSVFSSSLYGNCYTINGPMGDIDPYWTTSFSGPMYGLSLQLFIEQDEYLTGYTEIAGARVVVHSQDKMPFPEDNGFMVSPGLATSIGIRKVEIDREPYPYTDCVVTGDSDYVNLYMTDYSVGYSVQTCMKMCYQNEVIEQCGCADPLYPFTRAHDVCKSSNSTQMYCKAMIDYMYVMQTDDLKCDCPQACSDVGFTTEISSAIWPANSYKGTLLEYLKGSNRKVEQLVGDDLRDNTDNVGENLLRVDIYYQELNYEMIVQEPSYVWTDLGSDFGGLIGLWIGVSVLTCFEFLEFLIDLFRILYSRGCSAEKRTPATPDIGRTNGDNFIMDKFNNDNVGAERSPIANEGSIFGAEYLSRTYGPTHS